MTRLPALLLVLSALLSVPPIPAGAQTAPSPAWQEPLDEGRDLAREGKHAEAVKLFRKADKLAGGSCIECQVGLSAAFNQMGAYKEALKSVDAILKQTQEPAHLFRAYHNQGLALYGLAGDDPAKMRPAEDAFRRALELSGGKANATRFSLAMTILRQSRDEEGIALLKQYVEQEPDSANAEEARDLIANPVRARKKLIPDFELATLAGDYYTSEDLRGKVVLLDFWATWCPPCVAAVPSLRTMSRRMADEPFVLLSISVDHDEASLKEFIAKNRMEWPQVWDQRSELTRKCKVNTFPTYLLVSHEGEVLYAASGWGDGIERELSKRLASAVRAARKSAKPAAETTR